MKQQDTICALATANGVGAIAVIRVSGAEAITVVDGVFKGKNLTKVASHTAHFGAIMNQETVIDEVLVTVFKSPRSFTKENVVEIGCHGSPFIIQSILRLLVSSGCRLAEAGEFTQRAFLNGAYDLTQAEAIADLIAADSAAAHRTALNQMRGGFSKQLAMLREELIHFASLVELELDFGEEDVQFAERDDLKQLILKLQGSIRPLIDSFQYGNALKEGIPVAIVGAPNVGKSTLLNALLNEERAIVTPIAGTTRDVIEDILFIDGIKFRIIDTAGIRETNDLVESMGIERSKQAIEKADVVIVLNSPLTPSGGILDIDVPHSKTIRVMNKIDLLDETMLKQTQSDNSYILISAKTGVGIEILKQTILSNVQRPTSEVITTNLRHYEHLQKTNQALDDVLSGLDSGITGDFLAQDIRLALYHLGEITGTIVSDDLLKNIFGKFCIGK